MREPTNPTALKFQGQLELMALEGKVVEFEQTTQTAADAAAAIGCDVGQIVKSLIFKTEDTNKPVLVFTSGSNRVDVAKVEALVDEALDKADADFVREVTGYAIGGVPPFGFEPLELTFMDEDLNGHEEIWAAAGTPNAVFPLTPQELLNHTKARVVKVA
ncbi:MAG: YbaK/EbsC family protein [Anaerolineales bacterium]